MFFVGKTEIIAYSLFIKHNQGVLTLLAIAFFTLIFSSLLWLIYALGFIHDSLAGISFFEAGAANILIYMLLVCAPIFLIWAVFGYVNQYLNNKNVNLQLRKLMGQMKKNQDYSDLLARALIETEQHINDGFVLSKFDLLIADMNELLSEIIRGCKLSSPEQIESLWNKVQNGGKWSFGKVIIEVHNSQPNFQKRTLERAVYDPMLGGTIMEFCARYQAVVTMLENHDRDKLFLEMIETGVMGKVFSIMSPIAAEIHRGREAVAGFAPEPEIPPARIEIKAPLRPRHAPDPEVEEAHKESLIEKFSFFKRKKPAEEPLRREPERDPFSIALERSFGDEEDEDISTPRLSVSFEEETIPAAPVFNEPAEEMPAPEIAAEPTDTQKKLDSLRKEWAENRIEPTAEETKNAEEEISEENLAYPFGSWTDEQNYSK